MSEWRELSFQELYDAGQNLGNLYAAQKRYELWRSRANIPFKHDSREWHWIGGYSSLEEAEKYKYLWDRDWFDWYNDKSYWVIRQITVIESIVYSEVEDATN